MDSRRLLSTWEALNAGIFDLSEAQLQELLAEEKAGKHRKMFVLRIHSRLNRLRGQRERRQLLSEGEK